MAANDPRHEAEEYLKHFLYTAGNPTEGLRRHPDCDKQIEALIGFIIDAAKQEIMKELKPNVIATPKDQTVEPAQTVQQSSDSIPLRIR